MPARFALICDGSSSRWDFEAYEAPRHFYDGIRTEQCQPPFQIFFPLKNLAIDVRD